MNPSMSGSRQVGEISMRWCGFSGKLAALGRRRADWLSRQFVEENEPRPIGSEDAGRECVGDGKCSGIWVEFRVF
jgi:hypothetical protein